MFERKKKDMAFLKRHTGPLLAILATLIIVASVAFVLVQARQAQARQAQASTHSPTDVNIVGTWKGATKFLSDPKRPPEQLTLIFQADSASKTSGTLTAKIQGISVPGTGRWFTAKDNTIIFYFLEPVVFEKQQLYVQVTHRVVFTDINDFTSDGEGAGAIVTPSGVIVAATNQTQSTLQ